MKFINHRINDFIELEIESRRAQPDNLKVEEVEKVQNLGRDDAPVPRQSYSIAIGRENRVIRP